MSAPLLSPRSLDLEVIETIETTVRARGESGALLHAELPCFCPMDPFSVSCPSVTTVAVQWSAD